MLNTQIGALSSQAGTLTQELEEVSALRTLQVLNGTVDGKTSLEFSGEASFTATAALAEGQIVDHWTLNGEAQENSASETFEFTANADTVVAAVVREEKKLVTVNAEIRFLDADGNPTGESLTEFVFENEYVNPVTGETCEGGKISAEIKAVIPGGKMVDYWIVNGVEYHFSTGVSAFVVENLDEATTYEVVLKDIPITYYQVTCINCGSPLPEGAKFCGECGQRVAQKAAPAPAPAPVYEAPAPAPVYEAPTEAPTEEPTEAPTEEPTEASRETAPGRDFSDRTGNRKDKDEEKSGGNTLLIVLIVAVAAVAVAGIGAFVVLKMKKSK